MPDDRKSGGRHGDSHRERERDTHRKRKHSPEEEEERRKEGRRDRYQSKDLGLMDAPRERENQKGRDDREHGRRLDRSNDAPVDRELGRERDNKHSGREKEKERDGKDKERDVKEKGRDGRDKDRDGRQRERDGRESERDGRVKERDGREKESDGHSGLKRKADGSRDQREKQKRFGYEEENGDKAAGRIVETGASGPTGAINGSSTHLDQNGSNGMSTTANGLSTVTPSGLTGAPLPVSGAPNMASVADGAKAHPIPSPKVDNTGTASSSAAMGSEAPPVKPPSVSLDALAKAKKALQMQKELAEKLKRLPQLNKTGSETMTAPPSSSAAVPGGLTSVQAAQTLPSQLNQGVMSLQGAIAPNMLGMMPGMMPGMPGIGAGNVGALANYEAIKRAHDLALRLGFHQVPFGMPIMPTMIPTHLTDDMGGLGSKSVKAPVLRLDAQGREIDEQGNVVERSKVTNVSTLKVNINKQKKEAFQILRPELEEDPVDHPFFDERVGSDKKKLVRPKRSTFQFVEEGKWSKQAEMQKLRSQYGEAKAKEIKAKQAALSKAKAEADINPNLIEVSERVPTKEEKPKDPIPDIEWWDAVFLPSKNYKDIEEGTVKGEKVTPFVEHPVPIEPPAEPAPPPPQPLKLTKKEQKKLRTQRRLAKEKDRQEMIRQGLLEPPKSKVKMSNLMKVLGSEATQDPTRLEYEIRSAAAEREQAHTDRNLARKLTPAERREKKAKKLFDDATTLETIVSVYRVLDLSHPPTRFKVDKNATQNRLTGCVVMSDAMCVVVVEGGSKSIKRYNKLMTRRINWAAAVKEETEEDAVEEAPRCTNKCDLVWQGSVARPNFDKFLIEQFRSAAAARKYLADANVGHYWDLAVNFNTED